jgi:hypothetical protein
MNRSIYLTVVFATIFLFASAKFVGATILATSNPSVVYDDITQTYWIADLTLLSNYSYEEQLALIIEWNETGIYSSGEWGDFRLANTMEVTDTFYYGYEYTFGEYEYLFTPNQPDYQIYRGRTTSQVNADIAPDLHEYVRFYWWVQQDWLVYDDCFEIQDSIRDPGIGAWVVANALPTPEPSSILLIFSGVACLLIRRIKSRFYAKN